MRKKSPIALTSYEDLFRDEKRETVFPLYFVDGVAEVEGQFEVPDQRIVADIFWESSGIRYPFYDPEPEYWKYKAFSITRKDDYINITYVLD